MKQIQSYDTRYVQSDWVRSDIEDYELDDISNGEDSHRPEQEADLGALIDFTASAPEAEDNPQTEWVDPHPGEITNDYDYSLRLNYRLSDAGFLLDAARVYIQSESDADEWLELKKVVYSAKRLDDIYQKVDTVLLLEEAVYAFAGSSGVKESDYNKAKAGMY